MMEPGERCICQYDEWWNAFGELKDQYTKLMKGDRLTVVGSKRVGGLSFYEFKEHPGQLFMHDGFKPLRNLN